MRSGTLQQVWKKVVRAIHDTPHVHVQYAFVVREFEVLRGQLAPGDTGIVEEQVNTAMIGDH